MDAGDRSTASSTAAAARTTATRCSRRLTAILALHAQNIPHARCVGLIECCEESGSYDLPAYLEALAERIGKVDLVVGLDSGCGNYDQLWMTTSLRGLAAGTLTRRGADAKACTRAMRAVSCRRRFRIARQLLDRLEDARDRAHPARVRSTVRFREERLQQARQAATDSGRYDLDQVSVRAAARSRW